MDYKKMEKSLQKKQKTLDKLFEKEYRKTYKELDVTLRDVYDKVEIDGTIDLDEYYKYNRIKRYDAKLGTLIARLYKTLSRQLKTQIKANIGEIRHNLLKEINDYHSIKPIVKNFNDDDVIYRSIAGRKWTERLDHAKNNLIYETQTILRKGIETGDSYTKVAKEIRQKLNKDISKPMTLARTEMGRIIEETKFNTMEEVGKQAKVYKIWHNVGDERVRHSHQVMEGVKVPIDEEFTLPSGAKCLYPRNSGDASEDINCRCYLEYVIEAT